MLLSQCLGEGSGPWIFSTSGSSCMLFHLPEVFFPAPVHLAKLERCIKTNKKEFKTM